jgi:hypothetical protein
LPKQPLKTFTVDKLPYYFRLISKENSW